MPLGQVDDEEQKELDKEWQQERSKEFKNQIDKDHDGKVTKKELKVRILIDHKSSSIMTDDAHQTVQTQIKLHLKEQFDLGLQCLPINLQILGTSQHFKTKLLCF